MKCSLYSPHSFILAFIAAFLSPYKSYHSIRAMPPAQAKIAGNKALISLTPIIANGVCVAFGSGLYPE